MNNFRTFLLLAVLTLLFVIIGKIVGGTHGMIFAFVFACIMNFISYWFSDKIILMMYGAKPVSKEELPEVYSILEELTTSSNMPMPKVYLMNTTIANAFATGRNPKNAAVAVTTGILQILNRKELRGVLAHELAHIRNRDTLISTLAATLVGAIYMLADMARWAFMFLGHRERRGVNPIALLIVAIIAPLAAMLIQLAISRQREFQADRSGGILSKDPLSLASALEKLEYAARRIQAQVNPATAHLFIVSPFTSESLISLFMTHPPTKLRIKKLEELAQELSGIKNIVY
ncbi:MAG: zinc metalloprotease HtpX [bacterium]|nr:zinc metalloprotease HtpX [bacterium]